MKKNSIRNKKIIEGLPLSKEDKFFIEWGLETLKENLAILNETLKLFITLNTFLLSAYLSFYDSVIGNLSSATIWQIISPAVLIIISLISSVIGIYPFPKQVNLAIPDSIKKYKQDRQRFKTNCVSVATISLIGGFIVFLFVKITLSI